VLQYIVAGCVLGGIYAVAAGGLIITYQSAGVLNFSFGALAYTVARFYYYLNSQHHWPILPAALLSIAVLGPALGLVLYFALFRHLRLSSTLVKVLATIGVSVALVPLNAVVFGTKTILTAPGLAPQPVHVFHVVGVPVTMDQVIVYGCVVALLVAGYLTLGYTDIGLRVRAMVDSPAMTSLAGTNPGTISMGVWALSAGLAGLAGVLAAPIIGLEPGNMNQLMLAAFAAVIAARLRNLPLAVVVGLAMGIAGSLVLYALPPDSQVTGDVLPSIPFIVSAIFLVYYTARGAAVDETQGVGGALDRAIRPQDAESVRVTAGSGAPTVGWRAPLVGFLCVCTLPFVLHAFWVGLLAQAVAFAVVFLSFTLLTGEGGMIWLCQASFACVGAVTAALLAQHQGVPILLGVLVGGLIAAPLGVIIGLLTVRMGDLYIALVTLTFGLLMDTLVFSRNTFNNSGIGLSVSPPHFAAHPRQIVLLGLGVYAVVSLVIVNLRRSTTGLGLSAVRASGVGASTIGISVLQMKLLLAGIAAFVAAIGGGLLAISLGNALPANYATLVGEVWLAVLVTQGIRSNSAALFAGLSLTLLAGLVLLHLPKVYAQFIPVLFGLGAIAMVRYPEGVLAMQARTVRALLRQYQAMRPRGYNGLRAVAITYGAAFVALTIGAWHLWWLWLAVTLALAHVTVGYVAVQVRRRDAALMPDGGVTALSRPAPALAPARTVGP
jgi:branched-chain amino acid transport system permease protein